MAEQALRVCVLSDGQPGHYNQSRGILAALRRIRPVDEFWFTLDLRLGLLRNPLCRYLNRRRPRALWPLRLFYRSRALPGAGCDLLVSAGGKTAFANAWIARVLDVPNVYAGSLRGLSAGGFSVVLTLEPVDGAANNLVVPLPPSPVDAERVERLGAGFRAQLGAAQQGYWTLLLGGTGAGYRYTKADWLTLARLTNRLAAQHGIRWLLVSSRRSGSAAQRLLERQVHGAAIAATCWYGQGNEYRAEAWLGAAQRVFVTEDSMTMLTEAVYARRPVHSLRPAQAAPGRRNEQALQRFAARGLLCRHNLAELEDKTELLDMTRGKVIEACPTQWLAEQLGRRLGLR